mmetsp:Transcript_7819/g.23519  ORF Transcript_7819/g.23519 Transcript_7819/m.23519 type:complete len:211 (+) Transcript_7819:270-902(+)
MSSGTSSGSSSTPSKPTAALNPVVAHASAEIRHPVVVSATSVTPYPGLRPLAAPLTASVKMYTSASSSLSSPRAPSTMRLVFWGDTFIEYDTPRTRLIMPSSVRSTAGSERRLGTRSCTSPPPRGRAPRLMTLSSSPSSMPSFFSSGSVTVRNTSTLGSTASLVTPRRVMLRGFFPKIPSRMSGSKKYDTLREEQHSCTSPAPPTMRPGR